MEEIQNNLFPLKSQGISHRSSKKYRFREDVRKKIKERLRSERAKTLELIVHSDALPNITEKQDSTLLEKYRTSKASRLTTIIQRLWTIYQDSTNVKPKNITTAGRAPCFLPRNIRLVDKKRSTSKTPTLKRKKSKHTKKALRILNSKTKAAVNTCPEFYFRFRKIHTIGTDSGSNIVQRNYRALYIPSGLHAKRPSEIPSTEIRSLEGKLSCNTRSLDSDLKKNGNTSEAFKTCFIGEVQGDTHLQQRQHIPLFSNYQRMWKSIVKENDDPPD